MKFPKAFGPYTLLGSLGRGGMAEVFLARGRGASRRGSILAIKRILPLYSKEANFLTMLRDEARLTLQLDHPAIVKVVDFGEIESECYLAMEYIDGPNLDQVIKGARERAMAIPVAVAAHVVGQVLLALDYAHGLTDALSRPLNIIHRDISPPNVLIASQGQVKLLDFGIAKTEMASHVSWAGQVKGKMAYMSPEQALGLPLDQRSDLYSTGVVLYEMLAGQRPFGAEGLLSFLNRLREGTQPPPPPSRIRPSLPEALDSLVIRSLQLDPDDRYPSAREFWEDLHPFQGSPSELVDFLACLPGQGGDRF